MSENTEIEGLTDVQKTAIGNLVRAAVQLVNASPLNELADSDFRGALMAERASLTVELTLYGGPVRVLATYPAAGIYNQEMVRVQLQNGRPN